MQSRRSWRIRVLALAWPAALVITLAVNPAAQAGTTGALETKLRLGGPVPVRNEPTKSAPTSAIVKSKEAKRRQAVNRRRSHKVIHRCSSRMLGCGSAIQPR